MNVIKQLFLVGCIFSACAKAPPYAKATQVVTKSFSTRMEKECGFIPLGSGGFYTDKKVDSLYLDFEIKKQLSPQEAKALLKESVEAFVAYLNQNKEIRPFLRSYPVDSSKISMSIAFIDDKRNPVEGFSQIHTYNGEVYFSTFNAAKKEYTAYQKEAY